VDYVDSGLHTMSVNGNHIPNKKENYIMLIVAHELWSAVAQSFTPAKLWHDCLILAVVFHHFTYKFLLAIYRTEDGYLMRNRFPCKLPCEQILLLCPCSTSSLECW